MFRAFVRVRLFAFAREGSFLFVLFAYSLVHLYFCVYKSQLSLLLMLIMGK